MRLAAWALLALLAGCGGGGGGEDSDGGTPTLPPVVASSSISGVVTTSAGTPIGGVQVQLSGAATATATSSATGSFQFVNLADGAYTVTPNAAAGPFDPIGAPVTVVGRSVSGIVFAKRPPTASMQDISAAFAAAHSSAIASFNAAETALGNELAAQGQFYSGRHYSASRTNWVNALNAFASNAISHLRVTARNASIDRTAVAALFDSYAQQDATAASNYYRAANWGLTGSPLDSFIAETVVQTNGVYAAAVAQIP